MSCDVSAVSSYIKSLNLIKRTKARLTTVTGAHVDPLKISSLAAFGTLGLEQEHLMKIAEMVGPAQYSPGFEGVCRQIAQDLFKTPIKEVPKDSNFPGVDVPLSEVMFLLDPARSHVTLYAEGRRVNRVYSMDNLRGIASKLFGSSEVAEGWISERLKVSFSTYEPRMPAVYQDKDSGDTVFNRWRCPSYMLSWQDNGYCPQAQNPTAPKEFIDLMNSLFPDEESRNYAYSWARDAVFSRAGNILCLTGKSGIGKNTYVYTINALCGQHNSTEGTNEEFQSAALDSTCLFFDEYIHSPELKETLKRLHNPVSAPKIKGQNTGAMQPMHCSIVLANNYVWRCGITMSDRKFTFPNLTETVRDEDERQKFFSHYTNVLLKDDEFLRSIASYLYFNYPAGQSGRVLKTKTYINVCKSTMPSWFRSLLHLAKTNKLVTAADLKCSNSQKVPGSDEAFDVVATYNQDFGEHVGEIVIKSDYTWEFHSFLSEDFKLERVAEAEEELLEKINKNREEAIKKRLEKEAEKVRKGMNGGAHP